MRPRDEAPPTGALLVDKSIGPTSHDVVDVVRDLLGTRKVGHTGTLDPFASGLLILCVGGATRLVRFFHALDKRYSARLRLGEETETHDREGEVVSRSQVWREVTRERLEEALAEHTGVIEQTPPAFSAKRVGGRRAHRVARSGREVRLEPREVRVEELTLESYEPPEAEVRAVVSTGTYVRGLARDVGRRLGCGAHLRSLRRTRIGPFSVDEAVPQETLESGSWRPGDAPTTAWLPPARALRWLPARRLSEEEARVVRHGSRVPAAPVGEGAGTDPSAPVGEGSGTDPVALLREGELVAVAERRGTDLQPRVVLGGP